jgi:hypothetical protein
MKAFEKGEDYHIWLLVHADFPVCYLVEDPPGPPLRYVHFPGHGMYDVDPKCVRWTGKTFIVRLEGEI